MGELLTTSRLIAESAQAVAKIASTTANAARDGGAVVERTEESVLAIQEQVDAITTYMLDLGRKSQQIGAVVELITELAEQTNILAINATIEAGGAGEGGRRFAVVADEIRRLADRVGGSTKMIRGLVEDVRGSVNTTVMATESASKVVEAGTRQFSELAASFQQISGLVEASTEAAREIELSTKQQSTAVGQVNVAIANVAQSTRELETSTIQTLQTASELSALSQALMRIISSRADA
jgi:methyl-accepting chemotaxis protein